MKYFIYLFLTIAIFLQNCSNERYNGSKYKGDLNRLIRASFKGENKFGEWIPSENTPYDVQEEIYDMELKIKELNEYKVNLLTLEKFHPEMTFRQDQLEAKSKFYYSDDGTLSKIVIYNTDGSVYSTSRNIECYGKTLLKKYDVYDDVDTLVYYVKINRYNNIDEVHYIYPNGKPMRIVKQIYDKNDYLTSSVTHFYDKEGNDIIDSLGVIIQETDIKGNAIDIVYTIPDKGEALVQKLFIRYNYN